jgi:2-polyprenyl-3-methyl-5-hydroxy-6-metoxy-1,4-benzoquinol methylase
MKTAACELCGAGDFQAVHAARWRGIELRTVLCCSCGLVFHHPLLEDADRETSGATHAELHTNERIGPRQIARNARRVARQWPLLQDFVKRGMTVLEVGSSLGTLAAKCQEAGARVLGIEPDAGMAEFARDQRGLEIMTSDFETAELGERRFDLAIGSHVIEHFVSPSTALRKLRRHLTGEGLLFLETPNILHPKVGPTRVFSAAHNYHFSPHTLSWLLEKCGFAVLKLREFRHDSFEVIAAVAAERAPAIAPGHAAEVLQAIADHRRQYYRQLMFIKRKIPVFREWWSYRYADHPV